MGAKVADVLGNWATDSVKAPAPGGFQVALKSPSPAEADRALRFVVLHHTGIPEPHYDLMFETAPGSPLATWRSPVWPPVAVTVERLADHRRDYLEYEGPVSDDRGHVRRIAGGHFRFDTYSDERWQLRLDANVVLTLSRRDGAVWLAEVGQTG
jgi:hypothetical protein